MSVVTSFPKYALLIKKKTHTEVNVRNNVDAYNTIRKINGSFYSKENKKWYIPSSGVDELIDLFNQIDIKSYIDENYTEKVPFSEKLKRFPSFKFDNDQLDRSVKIDVNF